MYYGHAALLQDARHVGIDLQGKEDRYGLVVTSSSFPLEAAQPAPPVRVGAMQARNGQCVSRPVSFGNIALGLPQS